MIVEVYPEVAWKRWLVDDAHRIVSERVLDRDLRVYTPRAEDEFYLLATHAFSHMRVTESEARNAFRLTTREGFDWTRVRDRAILFGTHVPVYFFIRALARLPGLKLHSFDGMFPNLTDRVACALIDKWFELVNPKFPVKIPRFFGRMLAPSFYLLSSFRNATLSKEGIGRVFYSLISYFC